MGCSRAGYISVRMTSSSLTQCLGKFLVEVTRTCIEVRLENRRDLTVAVQFTDALRTLVDLLGVVRIVTEEHDAVVLQLEIEAAVDTFEGPHTLTQARQPYILQAVPLPWQRCRSRY